MWINEPMFGKKEEINFKERKSNKKVNNKESLLKHVENRLLKKVREIMAKLWVCNLYEYDEIELKIEHKIKL